MSGSHDGGVKTAAKNMNEDPDYYARIGRLGGSVKRPQTRWFRLHPELASKAGMIGGSKRLGWRKNGGD